MDAQKPNDSPEDPLTAWEEGRLPEGPLRTWIEEQVRNIRSYRRFIADAESGEQPGRPGRPRRGARHRAVFYHVPGPDKRSRVAYGVWIDEKGSPADEIPGVVISKVVDVRSVDEALRIHRERLRKAAGSSRRQRRHRKRLREQHRRI